MLSIIPIEYKIFFIIFIILCCYSSVENGRLSNWEKRDYVRNIRRHVRDDRYKRQNK